MAVDSNKDITTSPLKPKRTRTLKERIAESGYDVYEDIKNKQTGMTYDQLFTIVPSLKPNFNRRNVRQFNIIGKDTMNAFNTLTSNNLEDEDVTSTHCTLRIGEHEILALLDGGANTVYPGQSLLKYLQPEYEEDDIESEEEMDNEQDERTHPESYNSEPFEATRTDANTSQSSHVLKEDFHCLTTKEEHRFHLDQSNQSIKIKPGPAMIIPAKSTVPITLNINRCTQSQLIELESQFENKLSLSNYVLDPHQEKCRITLENHGYEPISLPPLSTLATISEIEDMQYYRPKTITKEVFLSLTGSTDLHYEVLEPLQVSLLKLRKLSLSISLTRSILIRVCCVINPPPLFFSEF
ncbi:hypothetical protein EDC96DRAFT_541883 [Choanephora cucurbitarum]|nr:hypothetical protein EDC96DRAFT_541883 [Choanephora cucurbitarum]